MAVFFNVNLIIGFVPWLTDDIVILHTTYMKKTQTSINTLWCWAATCLADFVAIISPRMSWWCWIELIWRLRDSWQTRRWGRLLRSRWGVMMECPKTNVDCKKFHLRQLSFEWYTPIVWYSVATFWTESCEKQSGMETNTGVQLPLHF